MKKTTFYFYFVLALGCVSTSVNGQQFDTLLKRFDTYRSSFVSEKIYVHTDQERYVTGETLWFSVYVMNATTHASSDLSKVVYVELLDRESNNILHAKVTLQSGRGNGSLFIPASIKSEIYLLRAYTQWMKNAGSDFFFNKYIEVVNPFVALKADHAKTSLQNRINLFPEGGHLVDGIESKVAFRLTNSAGKGVNCRGVVVDDAGITLAQFSSLKMGIGQFFYTPQQNRPAKIILTDIQGIVTSMQMPEAKPAGYVLSLKDNGPESLKISINANVPEVDNTSVYLFGHSRQVIIHAEVRTLRKQLDYTIDKKNLRDGINHFTLFDQNLQPVAERLYFKFPSSKPIPLSIKPDSKVYDTRRTVKAEIETKIAGTSAGTNLSVTVYKVDSAANISEAGIYEHIWLSSDLQGVIDSVSYYFSGEEKAQPAMDNLMLTHGWRRFSWNSILDSPTKLQNYPEYRGHIIRAKVKNDSGAPVPGAVVFLSSPSKKIVLYTSISDAKGEVKFEVGDLYGNRKVIMQAQDSSLHVEIIDALSMGHSLKEWPSLTIDRNMESVLISRTVGMQVQDIYHEKSRANLVQSATDSSAFYGKADETYMLDSYTRFPVMEEVMREYVTGVMVRKKRDGFHFVLLNSLNKSVLREDPLILIDGTPVFDVDKIMSFNPHKISKLEVVTRPYFLGRSSFEGIVSYSTVSGDLAGFQIDPSAVVLDYEGLQQQRVFFSPEYQYERQRASRLPDQRTLLYWNPNIVVGEKNSIEFFTSDLEGKFLIRAEALTPKGDAGTGWATFEVNRVDH